MCIKIRSVGPFVIRDEIHSSIQDPLRHAEIHVVKSLRHGITGYNTGTLMGTVKNLRKSQAEPKDFESAGYRTRMGRQNAGARNTRGNFARA